MKNLSFLEDKLKIKFKNKNLLAQAFVHRSFLNENPDFAISHNERLEFLGDAILEEVITEYLYLKYPKKTEGELTTWRAALVNAKMLAKIAQDLEFNNFLMLSQGELKEEGKARQYILANAFEAFIGALYLDQGLDLSKNFIEKTLLSKLPEIIKKGLFKDAKSSFQEEAQERTGITPTYKVLKDWGPDHKKNFVVGIYLEEELIAQGSGSSKQEAEEEAAKEALKIKQW